MTTFSLRTDKISQKTRPALLICVFLLSLAAPVSLLPAPCHCADIELPEISYGKENPAGPKILVAYATRAGSTAEVAQAIGKKLAEDGAAVDVKPIKKIRGFSGYQAIVLGSAIRRGAVLPEMTNFIETNKSEVEKITVACFIVCMILRENNQENREKAASYLAPLRTEIAFVDIGLFAGKLDYSKLSPVDAFVVKNFIGTPEGDMRDWREINDWARNLGNKLRK